MEEHIRSRVLTIVILFQKKTNAILLFSKLLNKKIVERDSSSKVLLNWDVGRVQQLLSGMGVKLNCN